MTRRRSTPDPAEPDWRSEFVDEMGALGPEMGLSRATMRIIAWMVVCDPPEQSAREIRDGVNLSAAAVSAAARELIVAGMLERVSRSRDRQVFYRLASGGWDAPLQAQLRALTRIRQVADRGIAGGGDHADNRLTDMRDAFAWFEERLDKLIQQRDHAGYD